MTAGPTREPFDPARYISNPSTGRMGFALAAEAARRGAGVTLIAGPTHLLPPRGVNVVRVVTAEEMFNAALNQAQGADLVLKAAAVSDYRPEERARGKLRRKNLDFVVANRIGVEGEGFESETNRALVLGRAGESVDLPSMSKDEMARAILDLVAPTLAQRRRTPGGRRTR